MADLAQLGIEIDTASLEKGSDKLDEFSKSADGAAQSADKFNESAGSGAEKAGKSYTSNAERVATAAAKQTGAFDAAKIAMAGMTDTQIGLATVLGGVTVGVLAAAAAVGVMAYQWQSAQETVQQALIGIGARSGATVDSINQIASASSTATGLSVDQARTIATELAKTGNIGVASIQGITSATQGFSILIGKDATKAGGDLAKIMGGDLVTAAQKLNDVYGTIDGRTLEYIRTLQNHGESEKAIQVILDNLAPTNQKAVESLGWLERAWAAVGNAVSATKNAIGSVGAAAPLQDRIASKQTDLDRLQSGVPTMGSDMQTLTGGGDQSAAISKTKGELEALQAALDKLNADAADKQLIKLANDADAVTKAIIPQIAQIQNLDRELGKLQAAQANPEVAGRQGTGDQTSTALLALQNQRQALVESEAVAGRYNQRVKEISDSYQGVSQATALQLQRLQNQLPVAQAIGAAARLEAQEQATIADLKDRGTKADEAELIAAGQKQVAQAAIQSSMEKQVQSSQDNLDLLKAAGTADEARLKSAIAYRDAIVAGADAGQAAAISANTLAAATMTAADASQRLAESFENAARAAKDAQFSDAGDPFGSFTKKDFGTNGAGQGSGNSFTSTIDLIGQWGRTLIARTSEQAANMALAGPGGINSAISAVQRQPTGPAAPFLDPSVLYAATDQSKLSTVQALYGLLNSQTTDKNVQLSNDQQFLAWLETQPATIANLQAIANLTSEMRSLTSVTAASTTAITELPGYLSSLYAAGQVKGFGFADGGVMTNRGPMPLHSYANGGVANSPQMAMFGEGDGPEAFVPLKDGKIPVQLAGLPKAANQNAPPVPPPAITNYITVDAPITIVGQGGTDGGMTQAAAQAAQDLRGMLQGFAGR